MLVLPGKIALTQSPDPDTLQLLVKQFENMLQPDQHLIHGTRYYDLYPNAPGHPFLEPDEFRPGRLVIHESEYPDVKLKFDICNQRVLLDYLPSFQGSYKIVLIDHPIREFEIAGKKFRKYMLPKKGSRYCQEIGVQTLKCIYYWHKELVPQNNSLESYYQYTSQARDSYLYIQGEILPFNGKKSFIKCFPLALQHSIREYIKERGIAFKQLPDEEIFKLLVFFHNSMDESVNKVRGNP